MMSRNVRYADLRNRMGRRRLNHALFISKRHGYVYVANPKAACSSIKHFLIQAELEDPSFDPPGVHRRKDGPLLKPGQLSAEERDSILSGGFFVFTFVRHPLRRAVSAYADKIMGHGRPKAELLRALGRDPASLESFVTFDDFVSAIASTPLWELNPHWRPQVVNLAPDLIPYDFIGRVETLQDDLASLKAKLGLPDFPISHRNVKARKMETDSLLTRRARFSLCRLYAPDFRAFRYRPSDATERLGVLLGRGRGWKRPAGARARAHGNLTPAERSCP
jgi:hypothetical protein